jgi:hypothetical protein
VKAVIEPRQDVDKLEEKGIVLVSFELPGQGRVFGPSELVKDPEGQQVANGLVQYLKLAVLKELRDHSKLNQNRSIISAELAELENAHSQRMGESGCS